MYTLDDIVKIEITPEMIAEAEAEQEWLNSNKTFNSVIIKSNHNLVGSLAHQIVEKAFEYYRLPFTSTRKEQLLGGDKYDIKYDNDLLDVKGHEGTINEKYFYNQQFLIFQHQIDNSKFQDTTHIVFCLIEHGYECGYIFGVIETFDFLEKCYPVKLTYENQAIKSRQLRGFRAYCFRTQN